MLNIAVFAPIPKASVSNVTAANIGERTSRRQTCWSDPILRLPKRRNREGYVTPETKFQVFLQRGLSPGRAGLPWSGGGLRRMRHVTKLASQRGLPRQLPATSRRWSHHLA